MARPIDLHSRTLHRVIHFIANYPNFATATGGDKVGHAPRKLLVEAGMGNGAIRRETVVQTANNSKALVAPTAKVDAILVCSIVADCLIKNNPAATARIQHQM